MKTYIRNRFKARRGTNKASEDHDSPMTPIRASQWCPEACILMVHFRAAASVRDGFAGEGRLHLGAEIGASYTSCALAGRACVLPSGLTA